MNVKQQILPIGAGLGLAGLHFMSICFALIGACNELAMLICIIFYNKAESSSGTCRYLISSRNSTRHFAGIARI
jgi:hypothetical protein